MEVFDERTDLNIVELGEARLALSVYHHHRSNHLSLSLDRRFSELSVTRDFFFSSQRQWNALEAPKEKRKQRLGPELRLCPSFCSNITNQKKKKKK